MYRSPSFSLRWIKHILHLRNAQATSAEKLTTRSKKNLREITLDIRLIWGIHTLILIICTLGTRGFFVVRWGRKTAPEKPLAPKVENLLLRENDMTNYSRQQERKRVFNNFKITLFYRRLKFQKPVSRSFWLENSVRWLKDSWENSTNSILSINLLMKSSKHLLKIW